MTRVNEKIVPESVSFTGRQPAAWRHDYREAIDKAKSVGLDLVEIAPKADPPVCRIVDYGKFKYEQSKLKKTSKSKGPVKMKEVKVRVRTEEHDYNIKCARAEKFLDEGSKVRIQLQFRGRENAHREIGFEVMDRVKTDLAGMSHVDMEFKLAAAPSYGSASRARKTAAALPPSVANSFMKTKPVITSLTMMRSTRMITTTRRVILPPVSLGQEPFSQGQC